MKYPIWFLFLGVVATAAAAVSPSIPLNELDSSGRILAGAPIALQTAVDRAGNPTAFTLSEANRSELFQVSASSANSCGDTSYLALGAGSRQIEVVDHSQRRCEWNRPYHWEAYLTDGADPVRRFIGG